MFEHLITALDAANARMCSEQRGLLSLVAEVDRCEAWRDSGARDTAHWLSMRYGISGWKAYRWIAAAHALDVLPLISDALARGDLGLDKAVELTRFAVAETEARLLRWALDVSCAAIRRRGDVEARMSRAELLDVERDRSVVWWYLRRRSPLRTAGGSPCGRRCDRREGDRGGGADRSGDAR